MTQTKPRFQSFQVAPHSQVVIVRSELGGGGYSKSQEYRGDDLILSSLPELAGLALTAQAILEPRAGAIA